MEIESRWHRVTDKATWARRGASFMAKAKATKVVWFPPKPEELGEKTASAATTAVKGTAKKTTNVGKKVTEPVRRKKSSTSRAATARSDSDS